MYLIKNSVLLRKENIRIFIQHRWDELSDQPLRITYSIKEMREISRSLSVEYENDKNYFYTCTGHWRRKSTQADLVQA